VTVNLPHPQPAAGTPVAPEDDRPPLAEPGAPAAEDRVPLPGASPGAGPDTPGHWADDLTARSGAAGSAAASGGAAISASGRPARPRPPKPSVWAQVWQYLRDPKRRTYVVLGALAAVGLVAFGVYAIVAGPPPTVEGVVVFTAEATEAQKEAVRQACPSVGGAIQEPPDHNDLDLTRVYPLRYDLTRASSSDRAKVFACVSGRPGVVGMTTETQGQ